MQRRITNPHKAGASNHARPAVCPSGLSTGRTGTGQVSDRVRREPHITTHVYDDGSLVAIEFLQFFMPLDDQFGRQHFRHSIPARPQEGAGVDTPSGSSANDLNILSHGGLNA